jgi:hypothetical protein
MTPFLVQATDGARSSVWVIGPRFLDGEECFVPEIPRGIDAFDVGAESHIGRLHRGCRRVGLPLVSRTAY